ncbi:hypothetical protein MPER_09489, partial [Moniliophthora perniciosa FA553]
MSRSELLRPVRDFQPFPQHMGRCIYGGIYEPAWSSRPETGLRKDVLATLKELNVPSFDTQSEIVIAVDG